jgi:hypothetical protein
MSRLFTSVFVNLLLVGALGMTLVVATSGVAQADVKIVAGPDGLTVNGRKLILPTIKNENGKRVAYWHIPGKGDDTRVLKAGEDPAPRWVSTADTQGELLGTPTPACYTDIKSADSLIQWYQNWGKKSRSEYIYDDNCKFIGKAVKNQPPAPKAAPIPPTSQGDCSTPYGDCPGRVIVPATNVKTAKTTNQ